MAMTTGTRGKVQVLDLTIINPCVSTDRQENTWLTQSSGRKATVGAHSLLLSFLLLAMSTCGELGSELIR